MSRPKGRFGSAWQSVVTSGSIRALYERPVSRAFAMPLAVSQVTTEAARDSESFWLYSSLATLLV